MFLFEKYINWVPVSATILDSSCSKRIETTVHRGRTTKTVKYDCDLNLSFKLKDNSVKRVSLSTESFKPYKQGDVIEISYNPKKPDDIMQGSSRTLISIVCSLCTCLLGIAFLNYYFRNNKTYQEFSGVSETFGLARDVFDGDRYY